MYTKRRKWSLFSGGSHNHYRRYRFGVAFNSPTTIPVPPFLCPKTLYLVCYKTGRQDVTSLFDLF